MKALIYLALDLAILLVLATLATLLALNIACADGGGASQAPFDILALLWAFANSALGVTVIGGAVVFLLGKLFTSKPQWEVLFDQYRGHLFDAVRAAEKAIPDESQNKAAAKADEALRFLLKFEPGLSSRKAGDLQRALSEAHDTLKSRQG